MLSPGVPPTQCERGNSLAPAAGPLSSSVDGPSTNAGIGFSCSAACLIVAVALRAPRGRERPAQLARAVSFLSPPRLRDSTKEAVDNLGLLLQEFQNSENHRR